MTIYIRTNDAAHPIVEYDEETCEHGLSAWLCMGPMHYPSRDDEMMGRYY